MNSKSLQKSPAGARRARPHPQQPLCKPSTFVSGVALANGCGDFLNCPVKQKKKHKAYLNPKLNPDFELASG